MSGHRNNTDADVLADLRRVADEHGQDTLTMDQYDAVEDAVTAAWLIERRFGSWRDALAEADLDAPPTIDEQSDEDLVRDLRWVADELDQETVSPADYDEHGIFDADALGSRFGGWESAIREAGLKLVQGPVTDEEILADLQRVADDLDTEWLTWSEYDGADGIVSAATIYNRFGSWTSAVEQAGLKPGKPGTTPIPDEQILKDLRQVADDLDTVWLTMDAYDEENGIVAAETVTSRFGSWTSALEKAGVRSKAPENVSDEVIIKDLRRVADNLDTERLRIKNYAEADRLVSVVRVQQRFGSWSAAIEEAGLKSGDSGPSEEKILADLKQVADEMGADTLTPDDYASADGITVGTVKRRFESWENALYQAGLDLESEQTISTEDIIEDLRVIADIVGEQPDRQQYVEVGGVVSPSEVVSRFGSWENALDKAGLEPGVSQSRDGQSGFSDKAILADLRRVADERGQDTLTMREYDTADGMTTAFEVKERWGTWAAALEQAGLDLGVWA